MAQTTPGAAVPPPAAPAPVGPVDAAPTGQKGSKDDKAALKALRADCREQAKAQRLKGDAKRTAVSACVVKARPDQAGREQCRGEAYSKGLRGEELHSFVKTCTRAKG